MAGRHEGSKSLVVLLSESAGADSTFVGEKISRATASFSFDAIKYRRNTNSALARFCFPYARL